MIGVASSKLWVSDGNEWNISGTLDELGASPIAIAKIDGSWSVADIQNIYINDWVTDDDNYVKVYTTGLARHDGKWNDTKYRIYYSGSTVLYLRDNYIHIDGLQIHKINTIGIRVGYIDSDSNIKISNNIIKGERVSGSGISIEDGDAKIKIWNNIIYKVASDSLGDGVWLNSDTSGFIYNNTIFDSRRGIYISAGGANEIVLINNVFVNNSDVDYYRTTGYSPASYNNVSSDGTANENNLASGIINLDATSTFVSIASGTEDFRLLETSSLIDVGVDLSSTSTLNFTTDIQSQTRPFGATWDIGADEYAHKVIYRSNGPGSTGALLCATSTNQLTISNANAIFSGGTLNNIGVGDVIVYNSSSTLAFITGRTSNHAYTVASSSGYYASSTTADTSWCIFRAYTSLYNAERGVENTGIPSALRNFDDWTAGGTASTDDVGRDLVANDEEWWIACYGDGVDTTAVKINGWTTGENNYIKVFTPVDSNTVGVTQRHGGKWDDDKYILEYTATDDWHILLTIYSDNVYVDGLQMMVVDNNGYIYNHAILYNRSSINIFILNNIISSTGSNQGNHNYGIVDNNNGGASNNHYFYNNIIYDYSIGIAGYWDNGAYLYNNTIYNCTNGIESFFFNFLAINNIVQGSSIRDYGVNDFLPGSSNNISSDGTANDDADMVGSIVDTTVKFVDAPNNDYHLAPNSPGIDAGTSSVSSTVTHDIDNQPIHTYDIGADDASVEFVSTVMQTGGDFSSLSSWEASNEVDLTATTTLVFSCSVATGTMPFNSSVIGTSSGAIASSTVMATSTNQILLYNIASSTFISGEKVHILGGSTTTNYCILSNAGNPAIAVAKIDGAWTVADETAVTIDNWTTGEYNYIRIYTTDSARHNGKWDDNKYRLIDSITQNNQDCIRVEEENVRLDGVQLFMNGTYNTSAIGVLIYAGNGDTKISNMIMKVDNNGNGENSGIMANYSTKAWNNILYDWDTAGIIGRAWNSGVSYFYNNTLYNCGEAIEQDQGHTVIAKNNITQNSTIADFSGSFDSISNYNISSDSTAPGTNSKTNTAVTFMDADNNDFRLMTEDTAARDAGTDLSADTNLAFTDDAQGNIRYDAKWDIGALEGPTILYRSVGRHEYDLNSNDESVTIATTTATFSGNMADNIGVGDAIEYGVSKQIAFITSRTSSTTYEIQAYDGTTPTATTTASSSVFRAHLQLDDWEDQVVDPDVNSVIDASVDDLVLIPNMDLTASNTPVFVSCYASTSADELAVTINGWTTATSSYIKIYVPIVSTEVGETQRHSGVWSDGKYRLSVTADGDSYHGINIGDEFIRLKGLQISIDANSYGYARAIRVNNLSAKGEIYILDSLVRDIAGDAATGISIQGNEVISKIFNNVIYSGFSVGIYLDSSPTAYIYNNTITGCDIHAIRAENGDEYSKNNAVFNNTDDFYGAFTTLDYNASDDGDGTNAVSLGSSTAIWVATFVDYENYDFRIKDTASVLYDSGTTIVTVTDDIVGNSRPYDDFYDIGAFEYVGGRPSFRFRGGSLKMRGTIKFK